MRKNRRIEIIIFVKLISSYGYKGLENKFVIN